MIFYHYTSLEACEAILQHGFRDTEGYYGFHDAETGHSILVEGVWISDIPLDCNETSRSYTHAAWLRLSMDLDATVIDDAEVVYDDGGCGYREWVFPAAVLNAHATVERYDPYAEELDG